MRSADHKGYTIFEDGRVLGLKGTILKPGIASNGYYTVVLCVDGKHRTECIHRLIARFFISNPENKRTVNHKNGNKLDNRIENLEWATDKENINHAFSMGLCDKTKRSVKKRMQKAVIDTETGIVYPSAKDAADAAGLNENTLRVWLNGFRPNKSTLKYASNA